MKSNTVRRPSWKSGDIVYPKKGGDELFQMLADPIYWGGWWVPCGELGEDRSKEPTPKFIKITDLRLLITYKKMKSVK